jgi:hypothetical protein
MAFKDRLSNLLAGPASQVVEAPVREIIQDALAQGTVASAQELQQLRRELGKSGERMRALEARIDTLAEAVTSLQSRADASAREAQAARRELLAAKTELANAAAPKAEAAPKAAPAPKAPAKPAAKKTTKTSAEPQKTKGKGGRKSLKELGCKVEGCEDPHRSKGFCSRHYQGWRRGRLEGFVGPEGYVQVGERGFRVAPQLQGEAVAVTGSGKRTSLKVDGKKIDFSEMD